MKTSDDPWLCLLLVLVPLTLLFLRMRYPNASQRSETVILAIATIAFFSICSFLLSAPASEAEPVRTTAADQRSR